MAIPLTHLLLPYSPTLIVAVSIILCTDPSAHCNHWAYGAARMGCATSVAVMTNTAPQLLFHRCSRSSPLIFILALSLCCRLQLSHEFIVKGPKFEKAVGVFSKWVMKQTFDATA